MSPSDAYNAIVTQIKNSTNLLYIKDNNIFKGYRESIVTYPCLYIEPDVTEESESDINGKVDIRFTVVIVGIVKSQDSDKQITGDENVKGILDLENDIKKAVMEDTTLSSNVLDVNIQTSGYDFNEWPLRTVEIRASLYFRQNRVNRS